jgi:hypothetical protein
MAPSGRRPYAPGIWAAVTRERHHSVANFCIFFLGSDMRRACFDLPKIERRQTRLGDAFATAIAALREALYSTPMQRFCDVPQSCGMRHRMHRPANLGQGPFAPLRSHARTTAQSPLGPRFEGHFDVR